MKGVLLTGAGGFVGAHFVDHILLNTDWQIVCLCSWQHKGIPQRILDSEHYQAHKDRVEIFTHDLTAPIGDITIDRIGHIDYILNLASESHVDRSITDSVPFIKNNIDLALTMLEYARKVKPEVFLQFSTDEVFGPMIDLPHGEWDPIIPSNPYSASKASQEAIAMSYWRTYGVPLIITNTMNIIGERQDNEKYLPKIVNSLLNGSTLTIHAQNGVAGSRYYLHARNAADAIVSIIRGIIPTMFPAVNKPERFNVVGKTELSNLDLALMVAKIMGKKLKYEFVDVHTTRPGHDPRYGLDGAKLAATGYNYPVSFEETLEKTIKWMIAKENLKWL